MDELACRSVDPLGLKYATAYLFWGGVADKAEAPGLGGAVLHDLGRGDGSVGGKLCAQLVIIHTVSQVLDVQVHALVLGDLLLASIVKPASTIKLSI